MEIADKDYKYNDVSTGKRIGIGALVYILIFFAGCMLSSIGWFFVLPAKDSFYYFAGTVGVLLWAAAIVVSVIEGFKALKEWNYRRKIKYDENGYRIFNFHKEEKSYLVVEFAKAKYKKYCPKIDWVDKK